MAKTGLRAWIFDAEQDFNNIDYVEEQIKAFKEAGYSDQWIAENLRLTCFPSELFYYWGESDHSTTGSIIGTLETVRSITALTVILMRMGSWCMTVR